MNKILFIITGSIAAYKCKEIISLLNNQSFEISCIVSREAKKYINLNELCKITKNRIFTDEAEEKNKMLHITLSRKNDLIVVCPATANSIAKFANGYGNNLASNTMLASDKKIIFVPAMNSLMWTKKSNQANIKTIKDRGYDFVGPEIGNLKCGEFGIGRLASTNKIINTLKNNLQNLNLFKNKKCLVTAGPTIEMIDPIRYISNQSSGKQGYEIASQLALNGAKVILISGPTSIDPPSNVKLVKIKSAEEMLKKINNLKNIDYGFFTAAVSDYKNQKIKKLKYKKKKSLNLKLIENIDILKKIGNNKNKRPKILLGFAAETGGTDSAKAKLKNKNLDIIVYNKINKNNQVFGSDFNKISIITKNKIVNFKKMTKTNCAKEIIKYVYNYKLINE